MAKLVSDSTQRLLYLIAMLLFAIGAGMAIVSLRKHAILEFSLLPLPALFALAAVTTLLNTASFRLMTTISGKPLALRQCLEVTVFGTAANMLPLPGAFAVRMAALAKNNTSLGSATRILLGFAFLALGLTMLLASLALLAHYPSINALVGVLGCCAVGGIGAGLWLLQACSATRLAMLQASALQSALLVVEIARIALSFLVIGLAVSAIEATLVSSASAAGMIVTFIPAGLGIRELASAGIGNLIGLSASAAFLAAAVNRLAGLLLLALLTAYLASRQDTGDAGSAVK